MSNVQSVGKILGNQQTTTIETKQNNLYRVNFKAVNDENDKFVRQSRPQPVYTQPPMLNQQDMMMKALEEQKKKEKKQNFKNNLGWGIGIASGLAIIAMVAMQIKAMKGGGIGEFKIGNLEFKNLKNDTSIFDLKNSKSLHPDSKKFFLDMAEKDSIPENIAKRAGVVGKSGTNAVILLGNSGVGKTELIKAYAKHTDSEYVAISLADFANSYVNGTAINIKSMFDILAQKAKADPKKQIVVSLDEIDAIIKRSGSKSSDEVHKNRQALLMSLDKILELPNIKLFASSNANINTLDAASVRRFGCNFTVPMPDKTQLKEALKFQLRDCEGALENSGKFFKGNAKLDNFLETLVKRKCAFGDIKNIVKNAQDAYALDMTRTNNATKEFQVEYLDNALKKIQTTAGEMTELTGTAM